MVYLLYDILVLFVGCCLIPYYLLRGIRYGKTRRGIRERIALYRPDQLARLAGRKVVWVHAVSVGETRAAIPLIKALRRERPDAAIVLTHVTETGREIAGSISEVDLLLFFPFDLSWAIRRALRLLKPELVILVETEIWPNFIRLTDAAGVPLCLVNGRISDRSYPRYLRFAWFFKPLLQRFKVCCMQSQLDAGRIQALGVPKTRISVSGNMKFDMQRPAGMPDGTTLRQQFGLPTEALVWVAGSTHPGEEVQLLQVYRQLLACGLRLQLVLVPRHPERAAELAELITGEGFACQRRSLRDAKAGLLRVGDVLLGDTLGEMLHYYSLADLIFVGGSLVPTGGHNALEASLLGKPVLFGPHMHNFKEISELLLKANAARAVSDPGDLRETLLELFASASVRREMGEAGIALLQRHAGATALNLGHLLPLLDKD